MASRENADGSMTYWPDGGDEPAKATGRVEVTVEPEREAKVVEKPEPKRPASKSRAQTK